MAAAHRIATVFGGSGFLGHYVVKRLADQGYIVRIAVRDTESAKTLRPMGGPGQIVPLYAPLHAEAQAARAIEGAEVVVNLTGILAERRKGDFMRTHAEGAGRIARIAGSSGVRHLVHISAIGANPASPSLYAQSKAAGEAAVRSAFPAAVILRPSIIFGPEDHFFNRFAAMASLFPVIPITGGGVKFQPVYAGDVADAVLASLSPAAQGQTFELGGPDVKSFKELIEFMLNIINRKGWVLDLPPGLASFQALFLERLPGKLLTRDQVKLLQSDNVVSDDAPGLSTLGIIPTPMDMIVPRYLARFRKRS
ncbi:3-beta-hydroxy-Delta(5)-steroid dehydrogenase [Acidocella aquatica]|uniref:3-beta-hydroxy-Delta(5)-steroid dehydrogenase n=1 Tax=Acidocella aquatica TaxID=1922313 RepID=A0ABQ6A2J4_9PROT|nr:complex I NDUFA9 subunit family protein [Acidocella aquatica]GLR65828.1 3-beta-hydroxy-Delta(5)-steroid dehydrogenase [Acidocella aquatica]